MKVNVIDESPCQKILEIEVPEETVRQEIEDAYKNLSQNAVLPGFRRGKVPLDMLKSHYHEEVKKNTLEKLVEVSFREALEKSKIVPISRAKVDHFDFKEDKALVYKAHVEVKVPVKLGSYKGLAVKKPSVLIKDQEVDQALKDLQNRFAEYINVKERVAAKGDFLVLDFEGLIDGKPFSGGTVKDYFLELGSQVTIPGFEDQLAGVQAGEEKTVEATFPKDFANKDLASKTAVFQVKIKEVKQKKLSPLNDQFAKDISGLADLASLTEKVKDGLVQQKENQAKAAMMEQVLDKLLTTSTVEVPPSLLEAQITRLAAENERSLKQKGMSYKELGMEWEQIKKQLETKALEQVKVALIVEAVGEQEKIEVKDEEVDQRLEQYASQYHQDLGKLKKEFEEKGMTFQVRENVRDEKTMEFLMTQVAVEQESPILKAK